MDGSTPENVAYLRFMDGGQKGVFSWVGVQENMEILCPKGRHRTGTFNPKMKQMGVIYSKNVFSHFFTVFHHFFTGGGHFFTEYR